MRSICLVSCTLLKNHKATRLRKNGITIVHTQNGYTLEDGESKLVFLNLTRALFCCSAQAVSRDEFPHQGIEIGAAKVVAVPHMCAPLKTVVVDHGSIVATGIKSALYAAGDVCNLRIGCDVVVVLPIVHDVGLTVVLCTTFIWNGAIVAAVGAEDRDGSGGCAVVFKGIGHRGRHSKYCRVFLGA